MGKKSIAAAASLFESEEVLTVSENGKPTPAKKANGNGFISSVWNFPGTGTERLYRWYGTLPRPLLEKLFALYAPTRHSRFLDGFVGSGSSLDVAADYHLTALGLDTNPLACLASECLLNGFGAAKGPEKIAESAMSVARKSPLELGPRHALMTEMSSTRYDYCRKWFRKDTLEAVLGLMSTIAHVEDVQVQKLMFLTAAQIIRDVASVDARCTHHLVTKIKPFKDPRPLWIARLIQGMPSIRQTKPQQDIEVRQQSILEMEPGSEFDLVLLHPPYLGVIHYHLIHRLATDVLDVINRVLRPPALVHFDFDHAALKKRDVSTDNSEPYTKFVADVATKSESLVKPGGRCVVIIGDQRYKGNLRHPFTDFIASFEASGFSLEEVFIWVLENNGGMHVLRRGHFIDHNYVLAFRKKLDARHCRLLS